MYKGQNLVLIPSLQELDYEIHYIGFYQNIERKLIEGADIPYDNISSGRLRRYFNIKNFSDPLRVVRGYGEMFGLMKKYKPDVVSSEGGFVAVPMVLATKHYRIPAIIHGSDMTPGLANKLYAPSTEKICCNFPGTLKYLPEDKAVLAGSPIHAELLQGNHLSRLQYAHLPADKPVILTIRGSLSPVVVNNVMHNLLLRLLPGCQVVHVYGESNLDESLIGTKDHVQYEYVGAPLRHLSVAFNIVISRAGANPIYEILVLCKPNILVPLPTAASHDDQVLNAESFREQGFSTVTEEEQLSDGALYQATQETYKNGATHIHNMEQNLLTNAVETIIGLVESRTNRG